jgi:hypothetical protein
VVLGSQNSRLALNVGPAGSARAIYRKTHPCDRPRGASVMGVSRVLPPGEVAEAFDT